MKESTQETAARRLHSHKQINKQTISHLLYFLYFLFITRSNFITPYFLSKSCFQFYSGWSPMYKCFQDAQLSIDIRFSHLAIVIPETAIETHGGELKLNTPSGQCSPHCYYCKHLNQLKRGNTL